METLDWLRAASALIATLGLALLAYWGARRFKVGGVAFGGGPGRRLTLLESLPLDPRRRLILVRLDGADHLILLSAAGDRAIATTPSPDPAEGAP